ncbi:MAG: hypothetical protein K6E34_07065 [Lachnospiraceae bacterium]|nr:hypothetical protein [Lachnospiraceae bacterium]
MISKAKISNSKRILILVMILIMTVGTTVPVYGANAHNYYRGVPAQGAAMADSIAQNIALSIMSNPAYVTDLQKVQAAASIVASYAAGGTYGADVNKYYRSPYGVFITGNYTCAGTARALGRVLDYMGYPYIHMNENQYSHQWCILTMDGQTGFADGMSGLAGYGQLQSGMTLADGSVIYFY